MCLTLAGLDALLGGATSYDGIGLKPNQECDQQARRTIAVGTALARWLGLPPAQIRASGTTALGSYLGFWRQIAAQATGE